MSQFSSHYRLASWAGLAPGCNESAGKKKSVKISRAGVYLKPALVEVAHCAVKDKTNNYYAEKYWLLFIICFLLVNFLILLMLQKLKPLIKIKLNSQKIILCNLQSNFFLLD